MGKSFTFLAAASLGPLLALAAPSAAAEPQPAASAPSLAIPSTAPSALTPTPASATPAQPSPDQPSKGLGNIGYFNASQLSERCSKTDPSSSAYCFAYLAAVTDTARAYEIWLGSREFCPPAGMSQSEVRRAFLSYLGGYPAQSAGQAASVIINALKQVYPCD